MPRLIVITGTDTGAGKTVLTALLARHLRTQGVNVAALKPICTGGRGDARTLRAAARAGLSLDEVNPWHFREPLAPTVAARHEKRSVKLREVAAHIWNISHRFEVVLVESAGGLLSPLGENFSTRELIAALSGADVMIAARNQLGVINHLRLTLEALPRIVASRAKVVMMSPPRSDAASESNVELLGEFLPADHIVVLPRFRKADDLDHMLKQPRVRRALDALLR